MTGSQGTAGNDYLGSFVRRPGHSCPGGMNLAAAKGTPRHKAAGWAWAVLMLFVTLPSFAIRELRDGALSWIHLTTVLTLISMAWALIAVRRGHIRTHARAMTCTIITGTIITGTMIGAAIAGSFALAPGRFISLLRGYGQSRLFTAARLPDSVNEPNAFHDPEIYTDFLSA